MIQEPQLKTGPWKLTDLADVPKHGLKVFSCFHCGGGSTMGYKLAGESFHWKEPRHFTDLEYIRLQSFPDDFNFCGVKPKYVLGMSVPPFMMQRVANQIRKQWFSGATED